MKETASETGNDIHRALMSYQAFARHFTMYLSSLGTVVGCML